MSKKHKNKPASQVPHPHCACVELNHPGASKVCVAGSFNDWHPTATPMISLGGGIWGKELALPPGRHEYRFVVDGQWMDDPAAEETVPNPFGGFNAVLVVDGAWFLAERTCSASSGSLVSKLSRFPVWLSQR